MKLNKKYLAIFAVLVIGLFIGGCSGPVGSKVSAVQGEEDVVINGDLTVYGTSYLKGPTDFYENVYYDAEAPVDFYGDVDFWGLVNVNDNINFNHNTYFKGPTDFYENVFYSEDAIVDFKADVDFWEFVTFNDIVKLNGLYGLGGEGNAYACLDFEGQLYRSSTSCV